MAGSRRKQYKSLKKAMRKFGRKSSSSRGGLSRFMSRAAGFAAVRRGAPGNIQGLLALRGGIQSKAETKWLDNVGAYAAQNLNTTGAVYCLNNMNVGNGSSQRIGIRINIRAIQLRGAIFPSTTQIHAAFRVMIVLDTQNNAATTPIASFLAFNAPFGLSYNNLSFRDRFRVLYDYQGAFGPTSSANVPVSINFYKKVGFTTTYKEGAGNNDQLGADINTNAIYLVYFSDGLAAAATTAAIQWHARVRFTDP